MNENNDVLFPALQEGYRDNTYKSPNYVLHEVGVMAVPQDPAQSVILYQDATRYLVTIAILVLILIVFILASILKRFEFVRRTDIVKQ
jgi:hypothetical protein